MSKDGHFATAAHVVDGTNSLLLVKERGFPGIPLSLDVSEICFLDADADFALLRVDLSQVRGGTPGSLEPGVRELEDGEPVYAFGYPLTEPGSVTFRLEDLANVLPPDVLDQLAGPHGERPVPGATYGLMTHRLSPRTTSAIISSRIEYFYMLDFPPRNEDRNHYVLDKALNYGNSGGPIIATETGKVHAVCTRFQPVQIFQRVDAKGNLTDPITIPSLYGVVTRLTHPTIRTTLENHGVTFTED